MEQNKAPLASFANKIFGRSEDAPAVAQTTNNFFAPASGCAIGGGASVTAGSISSFHEGDNHMGDTIGIGGDVTGSAVGSHASLKARDIITAVNKSQVIDDDLKQKLAAAAETLVNLQIPEGDKTDAADDLAKLTTELDKPQKDEGRIRKIWNRIKAVAPTVAAILASAVSLGKIVGVIP